MINIAQVGCGYWGPNLLRNFYSLDNVSVKSVVELDLNRVNYVKKNYPVVSITTDFKDVLNDVDISAVVIATPASTHYDLVKKTLESGRHCLVEKPLSMTSIEARELVELADLKKLTLMVGHTFLYNAAVRYLRQKILNRELGDIYYIYSQRLNLGRIRTDVNALWNLGPHDISIVLYLLNTNPVAVTANGVSYIQKDVEDVAFLTIRFKNDIIVHIHVSWLDPNKVRRMTVVGKEKMIIYDDTSDHKIQIYDSGIDKKLLVNSLGEFDDFGKFQLIHRAGDVLSPKIDFKEPLKVEAEHFIYCIRNNRTPISDGQNGLQVVKILEAATKSIKNQSKEIQLGEESV